jgi:diguanylate cyclase (GGDEF)-like protein
MSQSSSPRPLPAQEPGEQRPAFPPARAGRGAERSAVRAGGMRIALGLLGVASTFALPELGEWRSLLLGYVALALLFQWLIVARKLRTFTRVIGMGIVDVSLVSVLVHRLGTVTSVLPIAYVAVPVLYATTTPRRRVPVTLALVGVGQYLVLVVLELAGHLPYAPGVPGTVEPTIALRLASLALVALCSAGCAVLSSQLINALQAANARLRDLSQQDELTGLYNRRYVTARMEDELARRKRKHEPLTVAMVDLDGFKRVNDEEGHEAGDAVLRAVARALLRATRRADVVARYGGDEFLVLLPNTDVEGARAVAARILDLSREAAREVCPVIPVSASIGITAVETDDEPADVVRRVDERLYAAKRAGGDRII